MFNIYTKKPTTEGYNSQNVVQIIESVCTNTESKCNFCDGKIYWNPCVIHRHTKKRLPLSEPYNGHGTKPIAHRACKYNTENYYKSLVILEKDSPFVRAAKIKKQHELLGVDESGLSYTQRLIRDRTPEEVQSYNEWIKKATEQTFFGGK